MYCQDKAIKPVSEISLLMSNTELVEGIRRGSAVAAKLFHLRYSARISRWVWRLLGADGEHDDVVQQVFLNIWGGAHKIQHPETLESWIDSVTIKTVRYELRKRTVRRAIFRNRNEASVDTDTLEDERHPFKQSHIRHFYKILDSMPADDRIIFFLRYVEEYTVDQIAKLGNYSRSTAKRRLSIAVDRFNREALTDFALISLMEGRHAT